MEMMLQTQNLCKYFRKQKAVNNFSLNIEKGQIYGLLGPNGAGKSTTLKMLTGMMKPTAGKIYFDGKLLLDEPTNGLDPIGIEELRELIRSFPEQGITVILSSHILSEVQLLADKVGIISGGILGYEGALKQGDNLEDLFMNVVRKNQKAGEIHG